MHFFTRIKKISIYIYLFFSFIIYLFVKETSYIRKVKFKKKTKPHFMIASTCLRKWSRMKVIYLLLCSTQGSRIFLHVPLGSYKEEKIAILFLKCTIYIIHINVWYSMKQKAVIYNFIYIFNMELFFTHI